MIQGMIAQHAPGSAGTAALTQGGYNHLRWEVTKEFPFSILNEKSLLSKQDKTGDLFIPYKNHLK